MENPRIHESRKASPVNAPNPKTMQPKFIEVIIPATDSESLSIEIPPDASEADIIAAFNEARVAGAKWPLPKDIQGEIERLGVVGKVREEFGHALVSLQRGGIQIYLKTEPGPVTKASSAVLIAPSLTEGLWPRMTGAGRLEIDYHMTGVQDASENLHRFVQILLEMRDGKREIAASKAQGRAFLEQVIAASVKSAAAKARDLGN
jgi:hypothetical protein